jgi:hypothetical protein
MALDAKSSCNWEATPIKAAPCPLSHAQPPYRSWIHLIPANASATRSRRLASPAVKVASQRSATHKKEGAPPSKCERAIPCRRFTRAAGGALDGEKTAVRLKLISFPDVSDPASSQARILTSLAPSSPYTSSTPAPSTTTVCQLLRPRDRVLHLARLDCHCLLTRAIAACEPPGATLVSCHTRPLAVHAQVIHATTLGAAACTAPLPIFTPPWPCCAACPRHPARHHERRTRDAGSRHHCTPAHRQVQRHWYVLPRSRHNCFLYHVIH